MGGTDDPSNLIELSVEEHAEAHRVLYEKYGNWQDYLDWKGLTGCIGKEDIIRNISSINGKNRKGCVRLDVSLRNTELNFKDNPSKRPEVREKLSILKKGSNNHFYGVTGMFHPRYGKPVASTGKKWYHDPINNKETYSFENNQPQGYLLGRLKKNKKG